MESSTGLYCLKEVLNTAFQVPVRVIQLSRDVMSFTTFFDGPSGSGRDIHVRYQDLVGCHYQDERLTLAQ